MKKIIVTGLSKDGYNEYGERMLYSYKKNSPFPLVLYTNGVDNLRKESDFLEHRDQMSIPGLRDFINSCDPQGEASGKMPNDRWTLSELKKGYSFRFDARKFSCMVFTMWDAAVQLGDGLMIWLDGDSLIRKKLPEDFFENFLPDKMDYSYLGREKDPGYTETGFVIFRLPESLPILEKWKNFYVSGDVYNYKEWHSAYMFDRAREFFPSIKGYNLTPSGWDHAIHQCDVGKYIDHLKGGRKKIGKSPELTLRWKLENFLRKTSIFPILKKIKNFLYNICL